MAKKSNLHSLIIKSSTTAPEVISDITFRSIYRAVKDIIDYWSDITISLDRRLTYKKKYIDPDAVDVSTGDHVGDDFIDITGKITVSNVYLEELQYVCFHVNGNKDNMQGKLKISDGINYYILLLDINMHNNFIETITYNTFSLDGITLMDIDSAIHSWTNYKSGSGNENLPLCGNYVNELFPYTNSSDSEENRKNYLNNLPDKYLFKNANNVNQINVYDFTPYYKIFGEFRTKATGNIYGYNVGRGNYCYFIYPKLWSTIPTTEEIKKITKPKDTIDELWMFVPAMYNWMGSMSGFVLNTNYNPVFSASDADLIEASKTWTRDGNRTTIDRVFFKCRQFGENRNLTFRTFAQTANITHLCLDLCSPQKGCNGLQSFYELHDGFGNHSTINVQNIILLFSGRYKPPVTFSMDAAGDAAALAWLSNPRNIRWGYKDNNNQYEGHDKYMTSTIYYTASDPEVLRGEKIGTTYYTADDPEVLNHSKNVGDVKLLGDVKEESFMCWNMYAFVCGNEQYWGDRTTYVRAIYVPDEWYYFFKYSYYVYDADGISRNSPKFNAGRIPIGDWVSTDGNFVSYNTNNLYSFSDYKHDFNDNIHYNSETDKFWWQTNTVMNTIITKNFLNTDDPHRWFTV